MRKKRETPGKRVTMIIDEKTFKGLDVKIAQSDFFMDRGRYIDFIVKLLPFIPDNIRPDSDVKQLIRKMAENAGVEIEMPLTGVDGQTDLTQKTRINEEMDEESKLVLKMGKNLAREF